MTAALLAALGVAVIGHRLRPRPARCRSIQLVPTAEPTPRPRRSWRRVRRPGREQRATDLAAWCDRLARAVRSGSTLSGAVRTVAPPSAGAAEIDALVLSLRRGAPLADAVAGVVAGADGPIDRDLGVALTVLRACATAGGPAAEPLDRAAAALRARAAELADQRTQSEQSRLSAVVMTALPIGMLALLLATSRSVRDVVVSPAGVVLVVVGIAANLAGWRWMRRIIDGAGR